MTDTNEELFAETLDESVARSNAVGDHACRIRVKALKGYPTTSTPKEVRTAAGEAAYEAAAAVFTAAASRFIAEASADETLRVEYEFVADPAHDDELIELRQGLCIQRGVLRWEEIERARRTLFPQWLKAHPEVREEALTRATEAAARAVATS
ncbi:hypothetical protein MMAG44476_14185 [Mycolicibacterium mageritense DSM 44476 = CIP 104973]|uniref:Uncharacterized protein n=1 Tax=Mycolicibacterium mageritense TaxID=53462 RepID=A0ABM7HSR4_MYCME|nr:MULTISPECIES: hypothetical protein [Mycobacteriaceae]BBX33604.1 hypothetical protein MMAGJ_28860 [Mycolicibacterium mageritense]GLE54862.1 hypothetical protein NJBCHELONAE_01730 [Mycobacteroides chelonae]CDO22033.1 hypothetical protein BN978_02498 [Mycolicibacterium mageritense DSM 44476 = CIP 104973]